MTYTFSSPSLVATDAAGNVVPGVQITLFPARTAGSAITGITDLAGGALPGYVTSDAQGRWQWLEPTDTHPVMWVQTPGGGARWPVTAIEVDAQTAQAITDAAAAVAAASAAETDAAAAVAAATSANTRSLAAQGDAANAVDLAQQAMAIAGTPASVDDITLPFVIAHRGGSNIAPENSMAAWRALAANPATNNIGLEADLYLLKDGALGAMHDATMDRTTNAPAYNVADMSSLSFRRYSLDPANWFLAGWPGDQRPPLSSEYFGEFGGQRILVPEAKNTGSCAQIVTEVVARGLTRSVIIQSFSLAQLAPAVNAGIDTMFLSSAGNSVSVSSLVAAGIKWLCAAYGSIGAAKITECHDAGIRVGAYTIDRRVDRDAFYALGGDAIFSNDPLYAANLGRLTADPFKSGTFYHGHLEANRNNTDASPLLRGGFNGPAFSLGNNASSGFVLQGWGCPIKGDPAANAFVIDFTLGFTASSSGTRWGSVFICSQNDTQFGDTGGGGPSPNGYHILFRQSPAVIDIYKVDGGAGAPTATSIGTVTCTNPWVVGTGRACKITVTATQITAAIPSAGATNSLTVTNSVYRGGYFHFGVAGATVEFSGVTIT